MCPLKTGDLRRIFVELDKNGDGFVSLEDLNWLLERIQVRYSLNELESLIGKRRLDFTEFLLFWDSISKHDRENDKEDSNDYDAEEEADLANAFNVFDLNGDGFISAQELQSVLSRLGLWNDNCGKDCKSMIRMYDTNFDDVLDFEEFKQMMLHSDES